MPKLEAKVDILNELEKNPQDSAKDIKLENERLKKLLEEKEKAEAKEKDPMSGPGKLCECVKITKSEAWQLPSREVMNPSTQTLEMKTAPAPEGYFSVEGTNNDFYVTAEEPKPFQKVSQTTLIPNCRSKYTKSYSVFGPKTADQKSDLKSEPSRYNVYLCEKHAEMFKGKDPVKK